MAATRSLVRYAWLSVAAALGPLLIIIGQMLPALALLLGPLGLIVLALGALGAAYATNLFGFRDEPVFADAFGRDILGPRKMSRLDEPVQAVSIIFQCPERSAHLDL